MTRQIEDTWPQAYVLWLLGLVKAKQGHHAGAGGLLKEALLLNVDTHDHAGTALCLEGLAWLADDLAQSVRASHLLGAARKAWAANSVDIIGPLRDDHNSCISRLTSQLGSRRFREHEQFGFELAHEDVLRLALEQQAVPRRADDPDELTPREQEVADLVANGLTNREIAELLFVSKRTVDSHIDHIFTKLGVKSRISLVSLKAKPGSTDRHRATG